ncbi:MAG: COX15/CtaA family protein [Paludibacterium sp.]|uniref:COX15/CtaA family protein n=1 Tax=Paludibacterium sp. TaxID=1917523 RepID=UPI0025D47C67|nr:COX15/CtaA family protein [Paludibacterium sp.]MBV8045800.1 COX15/CtaA family protein [Paludibacterium sp.]MBV8647071.1 COX15/CtaA family protein [Paludibacterium sp.]
MRLVWMAWLLACLVVPLGAYVRLSQAGLGCPDWPGCYGALSPHQASAQIARAEAADPAGPVTAGKAWREMVHRYLASTLGGLILLMAALNARRGELRHASRLLLVGVVLQGLLGMWTVTQLLKPVVVSAHLLLGMTLAAGLAALAWRARLPVMRAARPLRVLGGALVALLLLQIVLGGWVSASHAALACQGFPTCNGAWWPPLRFDLALRLMRAPAATAGDIDPQGLALITIHWLHRLGALMVSLLTLALVWRGWRNTALRPALAVLALAWLGQIGLGVMNVLLALPLPLAVAHNVGALALLSVAVVVLTHLSGETV